MGADYVKTIGTHARAFFKVIIFSIGNVFWPRRSAHFATKKIDRQNIDADRLISHTRQVIYGA